MKIKAMIGLLALTGCVSTSSMPLGNDMAEINVSAAKVYTRADAMQMAYAEAAKTTVKMGYDKFLVVGSDGWNEQTASGGSYGQANINGNPYAFQGSAQNGSFFGTDRSPESKMIIKMFHNSDKEAKKAIDARAIIEDAKKDNPNYPPR
jgi:hypothetical protein